MLDPALMRLQYEIFNKSIKTLAAESSIPVSILQREADKQGWKQLWPDPPKAPVDAYTMQVLTGENTSSTQDDADPASDSERLAMEADAFVDVSKRRLQVYNLAKEILLSAKYLELEYLIVNTAIDLMSSLDKATDIKAMGTLYKDLTSGSSMSNLAKLTFGADENGLPSVIIRDLTGTRE